MSNEISLLFAGDFSIGRDGAHLLADVGTLLDSCDVRMFQLEEPYTRDLVPDAGKDKQACVLEPIVGKVDLVSLAGNHFYDYGEVGVRDTLEWCDENGIAHCGGGMNAEQAALPAFVERDGIRIGVLAWNCVGSKYTFARSDRGGTNGLDFVRAWVPVDVDQFSQEARIEWDIWSLKEPVQMTGVFRGENFISPQAVEQMAEDIRNAKAQCDVLLAYYHKGYVHQPVTVAPWERMISHIAIDNGADAVMSSHSHVAHGIEIYKGAPIFHGLNNFVMWAPQLAPTYEGAIPGGADSVNDEWIRSRVRRFGFVPDPNYPTYPFRPESVYCHAAKLIIEKDPQGGAHVAEPRVVLMHVEPDGVPYVHGNDQKGQEGFEHLERITREAGLNGSFAWDGDELVVMPRDSLNDMQGSG